MEPIGVDDLLVMPHVSSAVGRVHLENHNFTQDLE